MSQTRPKRKATINKSYNDSLQEFVYDEPQPVSSSSTSLNSMNGSEELGATPTKRKYQRRTSTVASTTEGSDAAKLPQTGGTVTTTSNGSTPESSNSNSTPNSSTNSSSNSSTQLTIPHNWQSSKPSPTDYFSHKLDLKDAYIDLQSQTLYCPQQENLAVNYTYAGPKRKLAPKPKPEMFKLTKGEYVYMVSEPPGEPYYIGRVLGFKAKGNVKEETDSEAQNLPDSTIVDPKDYQFQIQWFYRPRDISKSTSDSRLLFASMHTDTCPIASFRGSVLVKHKKDIEDEYAAMNSADTKSKISSATNGAKSVSIPPNTSTCLESYSQFPNCFYFDKLFDRYMIKFYDVLSTNNLLSYTEIKDSRSKNFLVALNKRFEYVFAESQSTKSLVKTFSSSSSNCEVCEQWCGDSSQDSIKCVECSKYYHMFCLDPPLLKKPSRGFSWSCAVCTKKHDIEYHRKKMLMLSHDNKSSNANQLSSELDAISVPSTASGDVTPSPPPPEEIKELLPKYESMAIEFLKNDSDITWEERRIKEEWPMRYLGMHSRLEDAVDLDDRSPYPRASTRLGAKHQATNIPECFDTPLVYYDVDKPSGVKKKTSGPGSAATTKKSRATNEHVAKLEVPEEYKDVSPKDYPQWLQPRPKGYVERGVDDGEGVSCTLLWKTREEDEADQFKTLDRYVERCAPYAENLGMYANSPNFEDAILKLYMNNNGAVEKCLKQVSKFTRNSLKEPTFSKEEIKKFENGVKEFGSELYYVFKKVKSQPINMIVRFYYLWKKSENGRKIWGNFEGRIQKKLQNLVKDENSKTKTQTTGIDGFADPEDDSCYESEKIVEAKKMFTCKHCLTHVSRQWFRITGHNGNPPKPDTPQDVRFAPGSVVGLCFRCARLWRRYAVVWEDPIEIEKRHNIKYAGWKKKIEAELVKDSEMIIEHAATLGASISSTQEEFVESSVIAEILPTKRKYTKRKANPELAAKSLKNEKSSPSSSDVDEVGVKRRKSSTKTKLTQPIIPEEASIESDVKKVKRESKKNANIKELKETREPKVKEPKKKAIKKEASDESSESPPIKEPKGRKRKPRDPDVDTEKESASEKSAKKSKRVIPSIMDRVISPIFNENYVQPKFTQVLKFDKKNAAKLTKEAIHEIISSHRTKQLTDLTSQLQMSQVPNMSVANLPFDNSTRNCCVCRELTTQSDETLICCHCGVNVHVGCTGILIPDQVVRPVKEWLCEPCINDLNPNRGTVYSCSLCLANESNYEFSMLGLDFVSPDYLKPISDTGKWCHLLCALWNYENVEFKQCHSGPKKLRAGDANNQKSIIESISNPLIVESVSKVFLNNFTSKCSICETVNGSMIQCDLCQNPQEKYHVTCAQDTANFRLGFKLVDSKEKLVRVGILQGRLKPILICPKHDETVLGLRTLGKRVNGGSPVLKPLMQLFIEDMLKGTSNTGLSGPQLRSSNYIENKKLFEDSKRAKLLHQSMIINEIRKDPVCTRCKSTSSPIWWFANSPNIVTSFNKSYNSLDLYLCQNCHHRDEESEEEVEDSQEVQGLVDLLNKPISGENYGITDENDRLREKTRQKISFGDILT